MPKTFVKIDAEFYPPNKVWKLKYTDDTGNIQDIYLYPNGELKFDIDGSPVLCINKLQNILTVLFDA